MSACARCKKPLSKDFDVFFDRKYHPLCRISYLLHYRLLRQPMDLDSLPISKVNVLLDMTRYVDRLRKI
jgi:hypothetical protein